MKNGQILWILNWLTNFSQALLFLLVLAGGTILCGRLCYCLSFSLSKVQCYLCKNKVVSFSLHYIFLWTCPCLSFKWIYNKYTYPSPSIKEPLIFVLFVRALYFFFHQIHPTSQGSGIWISAFIEYFSFPRFSGRSGCLGSTESIVYRGENWWKLEF